LSLQAIVVIAILVPLSLIIICLGIYYRKTGHLPPVLRGRWFAAQHAPAPAAPEAPAAPQAQPQPNPRPRGVWRAEPRAHGLPGYSLQAAEGELSLGTGRKPSLEEYELTESRSNTTRASRDTRRDSAVTTSGEDGEVQPEQQPRRSIRPGDPLPPYVPPPAPARVVTVERVSSRRASEGTRVNTMDRRSSR